jgi:site-specific DNA-methyltransferase (adenine-specific)
MKYKIYNQDVREWAKEYAKGKFHALLCDPPYHLTSIVKRFGKKNSAPAQYGTDGVFSRASKGFMGQEWDGGDVAFDPETWSALGEHLYPGAFGMAFSASRNWHRLAVAIEDAGFVIHPTIFLWAQGQGFPKATRIDTQIQPKSEQKVVGKSNRHNSKDFGKGGGNPVYNTHPGGVPDLTMPTDEVAARWVGHRYGLQALKPAVEPIICFQKPYEEYQEYYELKDDVEPEVLEHIIKALE